MADNFLKANISADGSKFNKTLAELEAQLKRFQNALKNTNSVESFNRLNRAIEVTKSRIASISTARDPFQKVTQGSNAATQSLINVGRVAQDLPFGIIGIANNLNPLLESFQRLKAESGSTGTAMKSLVSSLAGPAGIGVALSVVSSLLISFGDKLFGGSSAIDSFNKELFELSEAGDKAKASIEALAKQTEFLLQLADKNIDINFTGDFERNLLKARTRMVQLMEDGSDLESTIKKAFTNASKASSLFFENASSEGIELANAFGSFVDVPSALIEKLSKKDKEYFEAAKKTAQDLVDFQGKLEENRNNQSLKAADIRLLKIEEERKKNKEAKDAYEKYANDIISKAGQLASFLNERSIRAIEFDVDPRDSLGQSLEKAKQFLEAAKDITKNFKIKIGVFAETKFNFINEKLFEDLPKQTEDLQKKVQKEIEDLTARNPILLEFKNLSIKISADSKKLKDDLKNLSQEIQGAIGGAVEGIASSIGDALSGKNFAASILGVIGDLISQIGRALIKFAIVRGILDKILKNPLIPPGIAFALGAAAVAIGQLVKNIRPQGMRASGGGVNSGQPYYVGERGKELFVPNTAGRIMPNNAIVGNAGRLQPQVMQINGEFVVSGNNLIAVLSQATRSQNRLS